MKPSTQNGTNVQGASVVMRLPYLGPISHQFTKEITDFIKHYTKKQVQFRFIHSGSKLADVFKVKEHQTTLMRSNVVF